MNNLEIHGRSGTCSYMIRDAESHLHELVGNRRVVVVTDSTVHALHGPRFAGWPQVIIAPGEKQKALPVVHKIYRELMEHEVDRSTILLGVGGGVICDITGFVAATYLRGIPCGFVPTTLLAQVDASIGGKNGVNLAGYKNLVGTIRQPEFILCDPAFLHTLPEQELRFGFAEIIKVAAIADRSLLTFLSSARTKLLERDVDGLRHVIGAAAAIKVRIVDDDETEQGKRRNLNFGHTLGHAIEKVFRSRHGDAVAIGMTYAAQISVRRNLLPESEAQRLRGIISSFGLPTTIPHDRFHELVKAMSKDKKRNREHVHMILLRALGEPVEERLAFKELEEALSFDLH